MEKQKSLHIKYIDMTLIGKTLKSHFKMTNVEKNCIKLYKSNHQTIQIQYKKHNHLFC